MTSKVTLPDVLGNVSNGLAVAGLINNVKSKVNDLIDEKEELLGDPSVNGQVLSSTTEGLRSWVTPSDAVDSVAGKTGVVTLDKDDVGLDQVENTSDLDKPVSTAQSNALDSKEDDLSNPSVDGQVLTSTAAGVRSWVTQSGGSAPPAMGDAEVILGTDTTTKTINAAQMKLAVETHGGGGGGAIALQQDGVEVQAAASTLNFSDGLYVDASGKVTSTYQPQVRQGNWEIQENVFLEGLTIVPVDGTLVTQGDLLAGPTSVISIKSDAAIPQGTFVALTHSYTSDTPWEISLDTALGGDPSTNIGSGKVGQYAHVYVASGFGSGTSQTEGDKIFTEDPADYVAQGFIQWGFEYDNTGSIWAYIYPVGGGTPSRTLIASGMSGDIKLAVLGYSAASPLPSATVTLLPTEAVPAAATSGTVTHDSLTLLELIGEVPVTRFNIITLSSGATRKVTAEDFTAGKETIFYVDSFSGNTIEFQIDSNTVTMLDGSLKFSIVNNDSEVTVSVVTTSGDNDVQITGPATFSGLGVLNMRKLYNRNGPEDDRWVASLEVMSPPPTALANVVNVTGDYTLTVADVGTGKNLYVYVDGSGADVTLTLPEIAELRQVGLTITIEDTNGVGTTTIATTSGTLGNAIVDGPTTLTGEGTVTLRSYQAGFFLSSYTGRTKTSSASLPFWTGSSQNVPITEGGTYFLQGANAELEKTWLTVCVPDQALVPIAGSNSIVFGTENGDWQAQSYSDFNGPNTNLRILGPNTSFATITTVLRKD